MEMVKDFPQFGKVALGRREKGQDHEAHHEEGDDHEGFFICLGQPLLLKMIKGE
jgi:hypothetical protein